MEFYIKQNSELPVLQLRPIQYSYISELSSAIKTASVTFSMYDDKDCFKILNKSAIINFQTSNEDGCDDDIFTIQYKFTKKDTNKAGTYTGLFKINFDGKVFPITSKIIIVPSNTK